MYIREILPQLHRCVYMMLKISQGRECKILVDRLFPFNPVLTGKCTQRFLGHTGRFGNHLHRKIVINHVTDHLAPVFIAAFSTSKLNFFF